MKDYDRVYQILVKEPETRNSDKELIWEFFKSLGLIKNFEWYAETKEFISKDAFCSSLTTSTETIRRIRQKIQEKNPELQPTNSRVRTTRRMKEKTKGTFIYRTSTKKIWDY